jgi:putative Holliday junction resolvase
MARSLGLDVGNRRIGVAVSDTSKTIARPVGVIDRKREDALNRIAQHVRDQQPDEIIVGYPWNADGTAGEQARTVEQFTALLRSRVNVAIRFYDERFSTSEAQGILGAKKRKQQTEHDDAIAAAVILQRYLDERRPIGDDDLPTDDFPAEPTAGV